MYVCPRHYAHSSPFEFIWHGSSIRFDSSHSRSAAQQPAFSDNRCVYVCCDSSFYISRSVPGSSCIRPRVLFAYFALRTRRIRSSHFRHVCLCSSARARIDGDVDATRSRSRTYLSGEVRRKAGRKHCAFCCFLHVRELIYDFAFARKASGADRYMCA